MPERERVTEKPWGSEVILRKTADYVVKLLRVNAGCRLSLQYHRIKWEMLQLGSGRVTLEIHKDGQIVRQELLHPVEVPAGTIHRLMAIDDSEVIEVSTTELDDVVRLEDDYDRLGKTKGEEQ